MTTLTLPIGAPQLSLQALREAWVDLRQREKLRIRDAAAALGVSEAELLATQVGGSVTRLAGDLRQLFKRLPELGPVMALTRNAYCVHEKDGVYENIEADGMVGLALGSAIDLRLFFSQWKFGYAVTEETPRGVQRSLQIFDASGTAVHKVFLRPASDVAAFERLQREFAAPDQQPGERVTAATTTDTDRPDTAIDVAALRTAWAAMTDTHQFFGMLKRHAVGRLQALRLVGEPWARRVAPSALRQVFDHAAQSGLPIMVFVGNSGCIQIHTGPVRNIKPLGPWLNVLDESFNLHLREDTIDSLWVVSKPTSDGPVTSLELFSAAGETIAMLFGERKPGVPELPAWRNLATGLPGGAA